MGEGFQVGDIGVGQCLPCGGASHHQVGVDATQTDDHKARQQQNKHVQ